MSLPLIGISGSIENNQLFLHRGYMRAILKAGGMPVLLSPDQDADAVLACVSKLDGLLLAGGGDVEPHRFGEEPIPELGAASPLRDEFELSLLAHALRLQMPVLGVCRGVQVMNVALGGTLYQDLPAQHPAAALETHMQPEPYDVPAHSVTVDPASLLFRLTGQQVLQVNSMHHQAIKAAGDHGLIAASAADGVAEALEYPLHPFFLGVQWHPERLTDSASAAIFQGFANAAAVYEGSKR